CTGLSPAEASVTLGQPQPVNDPINNPITLTPFALSVSIWTDEGQRDALTIFSFFLSFLKLTLVILVESSSD
ncbi:hypothetical protein N658DRAFT_496999, partial [Parathielavia hyrcaniae]